MNTLARKIKLASLISIFVGLFSIVGSVIMILIAPTKVHLYACLLQAVLLTYTAIFSARMINRPSNAQKIMNTSSVMVLVCFIAMAFLMMARDRLLLELIISAVCMALVMGIFVSARRLTLALRKK